MKKWKRGRQKFEFVTSKIDILLLLLNNPSGISTSDVYWHLRNRFRGRRWIRSQLYRLRDWGIIQEIKPGFWRLKRTLVAYSGVLREFNWVYAYSGKFKGVFKPGSATSKYGFEGGDIIDFAAPFHTPYEKIMRKKWGEKRLWEVALGVQRETPYPLELKIKPKQFRGKTQILLLVLNNLNGVDTSTINSTLKEKLGIRGTRWIRQQLTTLKAEKLIKSYPQEGGKATIWKISPQLDVTDITRYPQRVITAYHIKCSFELEGLCTKLARLFAVAGKTEELLNTEYYKMLIKHGKWLLLHPTPHALQS